MPTPAPIHIQPGSCIGIGGQQWWVDGRVGGRWGRVEAEQQAWVGQGEMKKVLGRYEFINIIMGFTYLNWADWYFPS